MPGIYLAENQIGFDTSLVGFPSLGACMALALHTPNGIYGFHVYGSNSTKTPAFQQFCATHTSYGAPTHLYGSCKFVNRYTSSSRFTAWLEEMRRIATDLNYHGPVSGFDLTSSTTGILEIGAAYLEYDRSTTTNTITVRYGAMSAMTSTSGPDPTTTVKVIRPDNTVASPYKDKVTSLVTANNPGDMRTTDPNSGWYSVTL